MSGISPDIPDWNRECKQSTMQNSHNPHGDWAGIVIMGSEIPRELIQSILFSESFRG
jgi:hypothetical protein